MKYKEIPKDRPECIGCKHEEESIYKWPCGACLKGERREEHDDIRNAEQRERE